MMREGYCKRGHVLLDDDLRYGCCPYCHSDVKIVTRPRAIKVPSDWVFRPKFL